MPPSPQDRQLAIDVMAETFVNGGMEDDRATDLATEVVDEAIRRGQS